MSSFNKKNDQCVKAHILASLPSVLEKKEKKKKRASIFGFAAC